MSDFMDKMSDFFFKNDNLDELEEEVDEMDLPLNEPRTSKKAAPEKKAAKKSNLVSVPTKNKNNEGLEIVLFKAKSYDDMQLIATHIKERKIAVVNFEDMDKDVAQRMVDFLSGTTFALDGVPRKVSGGTFIFSSSMVDFSGQIMDKETLEPEDFGRDERFSSTSWLNN